LHGKPRSREAAAVTEKTAKSGSFERYKSRQHFDTTCAIVGGIVALSAGREALPAVWLGTREPLPRRF